MTRMRLPPAAPAMVSVGCFFALVLPHNLIDCPVSADCPELSVGTVDFHF